MTIILLLWEKVKHIVFTGNVPYINTPYDTCKIHTFEQDIKVRKERMHCMNAQPKETAEQ